MITSLSSKRIVRQPRLVVPRIVPQRFNGKRLLMIGFDPDHRKLIGKLLNDIGIRQIDDCPSDEKAPGKIATITPDGVLLGWVSKAAQSAALMSIIRSHAFPLNEIPVVAVVAQTTRPEIDVLLRHGVHEIVTLPLSPATLFSRTDSALNRPRVFIKTPAFFGPAPRHRIGIEGRLPFRQAA